MSTAPGASPVSAGSTGSQPGAGSLLLNILWLLLSGIWLFIAYVISGIVMCITIIGIPFGLQSFKLAGFALWPFGRSVIDQPRGTGALSLIGNILWILLSGFWLAVGHLVLGVLLCITIIGIPLGLGNFKLAPLALMPFGKQIVRNGTYTGPAYATF